MRQYAACSAPADHKCSNMNGLPAFLRLVPTLLSDHFQYCYLASCHAPPSFVSVVVGSSFFFFNRYTQQATQISTLLRAEMLDHSRSSQELMQTSTKRRSLPETLPPTARRHIRHFHLEPHPAWQTTTPSPTRQTQRQPQLTTPPHPPPSPAPQSPSHPLTATVSASPRTTPTPLHHNNKNNNTSPPQPH